MVALLDLVHDYLAERFVIARRVQFVARCLITGRHSAAVPTPSLEALRENIADKPCSQFVKGREVEALVVALLLLEAVGVIGTVFIYPKLETSLENVAVQVGVADQTRDHSPRDGKIVCFEGGSQFQLTCPLEVV
jgi:hypothetical protein